MKKLLKLVIPFLIGGAIGGLAIPLFLKDKPEVDNFNPLAVAGAFILAFLVQVVVHEFGHFLFGKLAGMQFYSFRVGFLALERENGRIRFKLYKNLGYLGLCIMVPTRLQNTRKDMMLFMVGGLAMNLMSFLICLGLILQGNLTLGFFSYFVYITAFVSLLLFVSNLVPQKTSGNMITDGQYIYDGLRQTPNFQHLSALFSLNALSMSGKASSEFMPPYVGRHQQVENPALKVNFLVYEYYYHLDQDNVEAAVQAITQTEAYLEHYPATQKKEIQKELLFTYAYLQPDLDKARQLFTQIKTRLESSQSTDSYRARAAYALTVLQDQNLALEFVHQGQQVVEKSLMKSFTPLEKKLLNSLEKSAQPKVLTEV
ncbi:MAG: M50 family metallopeptidase [Rufibacter sp.]